MLQTITWTGQSVRLLDQTQLPRVSYVEIADERQMWDAIHRLVVRGAPAIGVAAAFGAYLGVRSEDAAPRQFMARLKEVCDYLATSRPTAVNLAWALRRIHAVAAEICGRNASASPACHLVHDIKDAVLDECLAMLEQDARCCRAIGENALKLLRTSRDSTITILTHCNAGSLATAGYGTALAPVYVGAEKGLKFHVYADETRPLLQGSRITATELQQAGIAVTVICDNMAASVLSQGMIDAVLVGADRIAANGDTANKIGTLGVAILARHFGVPLYVCAPTSSFDLSMENGSKIPIEQRSGDEVTHWAGRETAPSGVDVFNPAFDVTPAELISAFITECGIIKPPLRDAIAGSAPQQDCKARTTALGVGSSMQDRDV